MTEKVKPGGRAAWRRVATFVLATAVSYALAVASSLVFPVLGAPGVSAFYIAAAIHVPLGVWMGLWGCLAGYISRFLLGLWPSGYTLIQSFVWSWADFIEALVPAAAFRLLKVDPDFSVKRGWAAKAFPPLIALGPMILLLGVAALVRWADTLREPFTTIYVSAVYAGLALAVIGMVLGLLAGHRKTWATHIAAGIILASILSGIWGAGTLTLWNLPPPLPAELFRHVLLGWFFGVFIVLLVLSTALLVALTPVFKRTGLYVEGWWA